VGNCYNPTFYYCTLYSLVRLRYIMRVFHMFKNCGIFFYKTRLEICSKSYSHYHYSNSVKQSNLWWYSERFVVITRQLQSAKCSLSSQPFGHIFTLLENLRFPYCCTHCKQMFVRLVCSSLGPCIKNLLFNFR
jgi:hypothetical protein